MAVTTSPVAKRRRISWRTILFVILAAFAAFLYGSAVRFLGAPWVVVDTGNINVQNPEVHHWHTALGGATGMLLGGTLLSLLWRPRSKPLVVQYLILVAVFAVLIQLPFHGAGILIIALPLLIVVAAYPELRALRHFGWERPVSRPLVALAVLLTLLLLPLVGRLILWQMQGVGGEHATANQWATDAEHTVSLILAGVLASTKRPGWRTLSIMTGIVLVYLGVAALAIPDQPGSLGIAGGVLALLGGVAYLVVTLWEDRSE